jgi:hypothetical protein
MISSLTSAEVKVPEGNSVSLNVIYNFFVSTIFFHFSKLFQKKFFQVKQKIGKCFEILEFFFVEATNS